MPSRQRAADTHVTPYLTHVISHHGQLTLIPPDNAGRVRKPTKKSSSHHMRPTRPDDEIRFNTGSPRSLRSQPSSGRARRPARSGRRKDEDGIPDYPPPTFLEAISTPPLSAASTTTLLDFTNVRQGLTLGAPSIEQSHSGSLPQSQEPSPITDSPTQPTSQHSFPVTSDSDPDLSSIEVVEPETPQARREEDFLNNSSPIDEITTEELQSSLGGPTSSSSSHNPYSNAHQSAGPHGKARKDRGVLDYDSDDDTHVGGLPSAPVSMKRERLSPFRALSHSKTLKDIGSSSSPYSQRSQASFFRSTTSLKMPSAPAIKNEVSRKLFTKGKERAEPLESWEVVDENVQPSLRNSVILPSRPGPSSPTKRSFFGLPSPLRQKSILERAPPEKMSSGTTSNGKGKSPQGKILPKINIVPSSEASTPVSPTLFRTYEGKLPEHFSVNSPARNIFWGDRNGPPSPINFLDRQVRPTPPVRPVSLAIQTGGLDSTSLYSMKSASTVALSMSPSTPGYISSGAFRFSPTPTFRHQVPPNKSSPLAASSIPHVKSVLEQAIETPLPSTPSITTFIDYEPGTPGTPTSNCPCLERHLGRMLSISHLSSSKGSNAPLEDTPSGLRAPAESSVRHDVFQVGRMPDATTVHSTPNPPVASSTTPELSPSPNSSPTKPHHFRGRPLPRPPLIRELYPKTPATPGPGRPDVHCPEGLLIDFGDEANNNTAELPAEMSQIESPIADLLSFEEPESPAVWTPSERTSIPVQSTNRGLVRRTSTVSALSTSTAESTGQSQSSGPFLEYTDLDLLASRLADNRDGSDYDTLLLISEFAGPGAQSNYRNENRSSVASSFTGKVDVERRRVTKDGRVKLKLSLMGVAIDRCGVCLSQFKDGESAVLGEACKHAFHGHCLGRWLACSKTCPTCREPMN